MIVRALSRLGELCKNDGSRVEIAIYRGTVMMLAYGCPTFIPLRLAVATHESTKVANGRIRRLTQSPNHVSAY